MESTIQTVLKTLNRWTRRASVQAIDTATQVGTAVKENGGTWMTRIQVVAGDSGRILVAGLRSRFTKGQKL